MSAAIDRLPDEALLRRRQEDRHQERWDVQTELTAQILETVSVLAADKRLRKPIDVPRPGTPAAVRQPAQPPPQVEGPSADVVPIGSARSAVNLLAATRRAVYVR